MSSKLTIVLLPGLDGTGTLFDPLIRALPASFAPQVVRYPADQCLDYDALVRFVAPQLPAQGRYLLLGESFSGPVAVTLAQQAPNAPVGLILCCTFVTTPRPHLSRCMDWVPSLPPIHAISPWLIKWVVFGRWGNKALLKALSKALSQVRSKVLFNRLLSVHRVDARQALAACDMPVQYWQASDDSLVPSTAFDAVGYAAPDVELVRIEGPHALLQARPEQAVEALVAWSQKRGWITSGEAVPNPFP